MDGPLICLAGFVLVVALLLLRTPIAVSLGIVGLGGLALLLSPEAALIKSGVITFTTISHYELGTLPLFLFMAHILLFGRRFDAAVQRRGALRGAQTRRACARLHRRLRRLRHGLRFQPRHGRHHGPGRIAGDAARQATIRASRRARLPPAERWAC